VLRLYIAATLYAQDRFIANFFIDEARFYLSGHVHRENKIYWATDNTSLIHKVPLHEIKPGVWCAISATRILGPTSF
jgi:hypothetical protein